MILYIRLFPLVCSRVIPTAHGFNKHLNTKDTLLISLNKNGIVDKKTFEINGTSKVTFTCSKSTIETLEKDMKCVPR